MISNRENMLIM